MIGGLRVLALVPARSGSKGLPDKNIRLLSGKPLLAWPIAAARASRFVDRVFVSTDSDDYAEIARQYGGDCPWLRPAELASDAAPSFGFIEHTLRSLSEHGEEFDILVLLEPTSPLTEADDIDTALEALVSANATRAEAIVGVSRCETTHPAFMVVQNPETGLISPTGSADFASLPRRQDLDPVFALDGSLYISTIPALLRERSFFHDSTLGYVTARHKHFEVDDLVDFIAIEAVLNNLEAIKLAQKSEG